MPKNSDALDELMASAEKKYNLRLGSVLDVATTTKFISTGNLALDTAFGGGIPMGRSTELAGFPSAGKTTTSLQAIAELQRIIREGGDPERGIKPDDRAMFLDFEQAFDPEYAAALGVDLELLLFSQPDTLEDGANLMVDAAKTGRVRLIVVDSVAAMNPSAKAEAEVGKSLPAVQAKLTKDLLMKLNPLLLNTNTTALWLNHVVEKFDMGGYKRPGMPPATSTPGGISLKYFASMRVEYKVLRQIKSAYTDPITQEVSDIPSATDVKVRVVKNKVAPPFREAVVRVRFGRGFDSFWTSAQVLIANKKIMYQAGIYYFHKLEDEGIPAPDWMARATTGTHRPYIKGESNVFAAADEHPEWRQQIIQFAELVVADNKDSLKRLAPVGDDEDADPTEDE